MASLTWTCVLRSIVISIILAGFAINGLAQEISNNNLPPPPIHTFVDSRGIDMISRTPVNGGMSVSIGTDKSGISRLAGTQRDMNDNHTGTLTSVQIFTQSNDEPSVSGVPAGNYLKVNIFGKEELFLDSSGSYSNYKNTGGSLVCNNSSCTYTNRDGIFVVFDKNHVTNYKIYYPCGCTASAGSQNVIPPGSRSFHKNIGQVSNITYPSGEVITYNYVSIDGFGTSTISAVSSSLGWMLKYYFSNFSADLNPDPLIITNTQNRSIVTLNMSTEYCNGNSRSCALQQEWPITSMLITGSTQWPASAGNSYANRSITTEITNSLGYSDKSVWNEPITPASVNDTYKSFSGTLAKYTKVGPTYINGSYVKTVLSERVATLQIGNQSFSYGGGSSVSDGPDGSYSFDLYKKYPTSYVDKLSRKQSYTYEDQWGSRVDKMIAPDATPSIVSPTGGYTKYDYDSRGNILAIKSYPKNNGAVIVQSSTYPAICTNIVVCNKPLTVTNTNGVVYIFTYDPLHGGVTSITKPAVNGVQAQTRYKYEQKYPYVKNSSGSLVANPPVWVLTEVSECMTQSLNYCVGSADEKRIIYSDFTNNLLSQKTTIQDGTGSIKLETLTEYDIYGNVTAVDGPRAGTDDKVFYFYDSMRQKIGEIGIDPDGSGALPRQAVRTVYNGDGKVTSIETGVVYGASKSDLDAMPIEQQATTEYSTDHGLPIVKRFYAAGVLEKITQKSYDNNLRLECITQRLNRNAWSSLPASACTLGSAGIEGNDRITKYTYDATGAVLSAISAFGTLLQRVDRTNTYSSVNGLLTTEADGKGNTTFYKYDNFNRLWKTVYPTSSNGAVESTTDYTQINYRVGYELVDSVRLRDGLMVNFSEYDALGRVKTKSGTLSESFSYNNFNQMVSHTNNTTGGVSQTSSYAFNSLGWLKSETRVAGGVSLGSVSYGHDSVGRRTSLTWPDSFTVRYDYSINGTDSAYLKKITEVNGTLLAEFDYYHNGRRKSLRRGNGVITSYQYNDLQQLKSQATDVGGSNTADDISENFTYALSGQLKTHSLGVANSNYIYTPSSGMTTNYVPDALNRIASTNGVTFTYDGRGNLTQDNTGTAYTYNANNLLLNATKAGVTTTLSYDAENRLHSVIKSGSTTKFMYDGTDLIAETNSSNTILRRYVHGPETDDPIVWYEGSGTSDKRYYTKNRQGSIVGVTAQSGFSSAVNSYDEFGIQKLNTIGRFQYTGQTWLPEVGLYYYKARLYSPTLGRFMQTDPAGYRDGMNWYAYVGNDPVNKIDPTGMGYICDSTNDGPVYCTEELGNDNEDNIGSEDGRGSDSSGEGGSPPSETDSPYQDGGSDFFKDLFRVKYQYEALQGVYGSDEQEYAKTVDGIVTGAAYYYYMNPVIEHNGVTQNFRDAANDAAWNGIVNNKTYFLGRQVAQTLSVALILRSSSGRFPTKATLWAGSTGSFMSIGGYGRALNLIDDGVRDEVTLMGGAIFGSY